MGTAAIPATGSHPNAAVNVMRALSSAFESLEELMKTLQKEAVHMADVLVEF